MANYATLKAAIQDVIKTNGNNEITGALLQQSLLAMINSLGANYEFVGIALSNTNPGTPDQNVFYIAGPGTYPNFNNAVVADGYIGVFKYNGSWTIEALQVGKNYDDEINQLGNKVDELVEEQSTHNVYVPVASVEDGKRINTSSGTTVPDANWEIVTFDVSSKVGKRMLLEEYSNSSNYGNIKDANGVILRRWTSVHGLAYIDIPEDAKTLNASNIKADGACKLYEVVQGSVELVKEAIVNISDVDYSLSDQFQFITLPFTKQLKADIDPATNKVVVLESQGVFYNMAVVRNVPKFIRFNFLYTDVTITNLWFSDNAKNTILWLFIFTDDDGNVLKSVGYRYHQYGDVVSTPAGATRLYVNIYTNVTNYPVLLSYDSNPFVGKNVAIIGDSISTNGRLAEVRHKDAVEITIEQEDVGIELSAYLTQFDIDAGLSIGGHTFTQAEVGTEVTFTPLSEDVGKVIGLPNLYNNKNRYDTKVWWDFLSEKLGYNPISVCWSGASISSHEKNVNNYKTSYAWHDAQIRKCGIRTPGSMSRTAPDYIFIFRGCNDMTHTPFSVLTPGYFDNVNWEYPTTDEVNGNFGFFEGYALTIKKLRAAYPSAKIYICTLSIFKRINYSHYPTNNGIYTWPQMNDAIRKIADFFGCGVIEFDKCGITFENCYVDGYITDSATTPTHPNNKGHFVMAGQAVKDIMSK